MSIPVTIALLTYNRSGYLKEAIEGVLSQTYRNFEFLILDNGSTDDTPDVVLSIKDDRIRYVRNPPGYTAPFNGASAIKIARGERVIASVARHGTLDLTPVQIRLRTLALECMIDDVLRELFVIGNPDVRDVGSDLDLLANELAAIWHAGLYGGEGR